MINEVIPKNKIDKANQGKLFFEFQLLKNIDHPHIIRIYEVYNDVKNMYLITE
jgi:calcium-dependent protein kinase